MQKDKIGSILSQWADYSTIFFLKAKQPYFIES